MNRLLKGPFGKIGMSVGLSALDVGARGGVSTDLAEIAGAIEYYGFEPDSIECKKLNQGKSHQPWKSVTYLPTALADGDRDLKLNLYRQRGCSSVLRARHELGERFSRGEYYIHDGHVTVSAKRLDDVVEEADIRSPAYMKIDVQGMELDVFNGAKETLGRSLVGVRTEVSFYPIYEGQPLFAEVDQALRPYGFVPMRWLELHEWRRVTRRKYPFCSRGPTPCSRGQMIHGDVLYLMEPEMITGESEEEARRLISLGLIASCYGHIDHAHAAFSRPVARDYLRDVVKIDPFNELFRISRGKARYARVRSLGVRLRQLLGKVV